MTIVECRIKEFCRFIVACCGVRGAGCVLRVACCAAPGAGCAVRVVRHGFRVMRCAFLFSASKLLNFSFSRLPHSGTLSPNPSLLSPAFSHLHTFSTSHLLFFPTSAFRLPPSSQLLTFSSSQLLFLPTSAFQLPFNCFSARRSW